MNDQRRPTTRAPGSVEQDISSTAAVASKTAGVGAALIEPTRLPFGEAAPALRRAGKFLGPLGTGLDLVDGYAGYQADVARGEEPRRAARDNGVRVGSGMIGAALGGLALGAPGAVVGGVLGERMPMTIEELRRLAREAAVYNTPRYWLNRRGPPSTLRYR